MRIKGAQIVSSLLIATLLFACGEVGNNPEHSSGSLSLNDQVRNYDDGSTPPVNWKFVDGLIAFLRGTRGVDILIYVAGDSDDNDCLDIEVTYRNLAGTEVAFQLIKEVELNRLFTEQGPFMAVNAATAELVLLCNMTPIDTYTATISTLTVASGTEPITPAE